MKEEDRTTPDQSLVLIQQILRKNRNRNAGTALVLACCCGLWLGLRFNVYDPIWEGANLLLAGGVIAATGIAVMERLRYQVNREDFTQILTKSPQQLVWVYYLKVDVLPFGVHVRQTSTLFFWMDSSHHLTLRTKEMESVAIMNALRQSMPHISFGYSLQKEQLYRADPGLLRR